jgi:DNA-directed RNA polymerase specialized sigma24 family protein
MDTSTHPAFEYDDDDSLWAMLYTRLKPFVRGWVYHSHMSRWIGEEEAVVEDIISETVERTFKRVNFRNDEDEPILSIWGFARQTAYHYFIDLVRKQGREIPLSHLCDETNEPPLLPDPEEMEVTIHETMDHEQLYKLAAQEIKGFPNKQRNALLIDHAKRTNFEEDPTSLQLAYLEVGIQLLDYRSQEPMKEDERSRHSSLLYHAYKRLSLLPSLRMFI